jgi:lipopolysaccharide/colanic/teichoic acid biosynthesis glycosyltransferase
MQNSWHTSSLPSHPIGRLDRLFSEAIQRPPLSLVEIALKRTLDLMLAGVLLVTLAPLLAAVSLLIKLDSRGPLMVRHGCRGFNGRVFSIYKFRTTTMQGNGNTIGQAPRVGRVGYLLRSSGIDALPQLVNVLQGHMSLVGPRPHAVGYDGQYAKFIASSAFRQHLKPGWTGWSQINQRTAQLMRMEDDLLYIKNWSLLLDLRIIADTFFESHVS